METIINAPDRLAHAVLVALCEDSATLTRALLAHAKLEPAYHAANTNGTGSKRPAEEDVFICRQCNGPYTETQNKPTSCRYHDGIMEPDYEADAWIDHDERCHGTIDSEFCREEYPEGFFWDCCGIRGDENKPCVRGPHRPRGPSKRLKVAPGADGEAADDDDDISESDDSDEDDYESLEDGDNGGVDGQSEDHDEEEEEEEEEGDSENE